jgi:UPF0755 protein
MQVALSKYGLDRENAGTLFIPNTYEFNWNTSAEEFFERMRNEHQKFWTDEKSSEGKSVEVIPSRCCNTWHPLLKKKPARRYEMPTIAGVYLNQTEKRECYCRLTQRWFLLRVISTSPGF